MDESKQFNTFAVISILGFPTERTEVYVRIVERVEDSEDFDLIAEKKIPAYGIPDDVRLNSLWVFVESQGYRELEGAGTGWQPFGRFPEAELYAKPIEKI